MSAVRYEHWHCSVCRALVDEHELDRLGGACWECREDEAIDRQEYEDEQYKLQKETGCLPT